MRVGPEDRLPVEDPGEAPWRWVCRLVIHFQEGSEEYGTGWLIGPRALATAGHCVYSPSPAPSNPSFKKGWATRIEVLPPVDAGVRPESRASTDFRAPLGWVEGNADEFDYGVLLLPDDAMGNALGHFGLDVVPLADVWGVQATRAGFPVRMNQAWNDALWWTDRGLIAAGDDRMLVHGLDASSGDSGSPVWIARGEGPVVVGLHVHAAVGSVQNAAVRVNTEVKANLLYWREGGG